MHAFHTTRVLVVVLAPREREREREVEGRTTCWSPSSSLSRDELFPFLYFPLDPRLSLLPLLLLSSQCIWKKYWDRLEMQTTRERSKIYDLCLLLTWFPREKNRKGSEFLLNLSSSSQRKKCNYYDQVNEEEYGSSSFCYSWIPEINTLMIQEARRKTSRGGRENNESVLFISISRYYLSGEQKIKRLQGFVESILREVS